MIVSLNSTIHLVMKMQYIFCKVRSDFLIVI